MHRLEKAVWEGKIIGFFMLLLGEVLFGHRNCPVLAVEGHLPLQAAVSLGSKGPFPPLPTPLPCPRPWVPASPAGRRGDMSLPQTLGHLLADFVPTFSNGHAPGLGHQQELLALQRPQRGWDGRSGGQPCLGGCLVRGSATTVLPWLLSC